MLTFAPEKLAAWTGGQWNFLPNDMLVGFSQDTRKLNDGQMFVALPTKKRDGHDFLGKAEARGASAALVEKTVTTSNLPQLLTTDSLAAFQAIAREHRREFTGTVVGVTGSAGKTSTKDLLSQLLGGEPAVCATEGTLNNHIGVPLTLTKINRTQHCAAVVEVGINMPGEMAGLAAIIEPNHSIVTLVGPAHLEKLGTLENVAFEKSRLPAANRAGGLTVFPTACCRFEAFRELPNSLVLVPANEDMARVPGRQVSFTVLHRPDRTEVTLAGWRTFLLHRISNGMAQDAALALALASELGVSDAELQIRLSGWQPSRWRGGMRRVGEALVYCDFYNANPASMQDAIAAFSDLVAPELPRLYVLGCMEELGTDAAEYHRQLGCSLLLRPGDFLFVFGTNAAAVSEGLPENGNDPAQIEIIDDVTHVRERLASFKGAAFLKGSRSYKLEAVLDEHAAAYA